MKYVVDEDLTAREPLLDEQGRIVGIRTRKRAPEEVLAIKMDRAKKREDSVLAEAFEILKRRGYWPPKAVAQESACATPRAVPVPWSESEPPYYDPFAGDGK
jgi:hypothetical protein